MVTVVTASGNHFIVWPIPGEQVNAICGIVELVRPIVGRSAGRPFFDRIGRPANAVALEILVPRAAVRHDPREDRRHDLRAAFTVHAAGLAHIVVPDQRPLRASVRARGLFHGKRVVMRVGGIPGRQPVPDAPFLEVIPVKEREVFVRQTGKLVGVPIKRIPFYPLHGIGVQGSDRRARRNLIGAEIRPVSAAIGQDQAVKLLVAVGLRDPNRIIKDARFVIVESGGAVGAHDAPGEGPWIRIPHVVGNACRVLDRGQVLRPGVIVRTPRPGFAVSECRTEGHRGVGDGGNEGRVV